LQKQSRKKKKITNTKSRTRPKTAGQGREGEAGRGRGRGAGEGREALQADRLAPRPLFATVQIQSTVEIQRTANFCHLQRYPDLRAQHWPTAGARVPSTPRRVREQFIGEFDNSLRATSRPSSASPFLSLPFIPPSDQTTLSASTIRSPCDETRPRAEVALIWRQGHRGSLSCPRLAAKRARGVVD